MRNKLILIILLVSSFINGQQPVDEIEHLTRDSEKYLFLPNKIYKNDNLWYNEDTNDLFTGRIEIFLGQSKITKISECTIIGGIKNGYFKQYYNRKEMLAGIMGLYLNDKKEGTWTWVEPEEVNKKRSWIDSSIRLITNIDYRNGLKHGTILIHKATLIQNTHLENFTFSISDVILNGEFYNDQRSGEWLFNDHISSDFDRLIESQYSNQLSLHWTRKQIYDSNVIIDSECREPWNRPLDCETYKGKYSNNLYLVPNRKIQAYDSTPMGNSMMVLVPDEQGNDVEVQIVDFIQHINTYHSTHTSVHKDKGHRFLINDDFRKIINEKYWE